MSTIAEKLTLLADTKAEIKSAIIEKGQSVTDDDSFYSYAEKIRAISTSSESGSDSGEGGSEGGESGSGSGSGSENSKLTTKKITENGTYNASDDDADGYSSVEVNVPMIGFGRSLTVTASGDLAAGESVYIEGASEGVIKRDDLMVPANKNIFISPNGRYIFCINDVGNDYVSESSDYSRHYPILYADTNVQPFKFKPFKISVSLDTVYENVQAYAYSYGFASDERIIYVVIKDAPNFNIFIDTNTCTPVNARGYTYGWATGSSWGMKGYANGQYSYRLGYGGKVCWKVDLSSLAINEVYNGSSTPVSNGYQMALLSNGIAVYIDGYCSYVHFIQNGNLVKSCQIAPYDSHSTSVAVSNRKKYILLYHESDTYGRQYYGDKWTRWFKIDLEKLYSETKPNDAGCYGEDFIIPPVFENPLYAGTNITYVYTDNPTGDISIIGSKETGYPLYFYNWLTGDVSKLPSNKVRDGECLSKQIGFTNKWIVVDGEVYEIQSGGTVAKLANGKIHGESKLGYVPRAISNGESGEAVVLFD